MDTKALRLQLERQWGQRRKLEQLLEQANTRLRRARRQLTRVEQALEVVRTVGLLTQRELEYHLSHQVSAALQAVFDVPYLLCVEFEARRGQTEVAIQFERDGYRLSPMSSAGGGAIDVASCALRLAYWSMRMDRAVRPVLVLDEPFARLKGSAPNRRALALLQETSHQLGLQLIVVSDERVPRDEIALHADRLFVFEPVSGMVRVSS